MRKAALAFTISILTIFCPIYGHFASKVEKLVKELNQAAFLEFYLIKKGENPLISPFALQTSLLMAYMGASGQTAEEIVTNTSLTLPKKVIGSAYADLYRYIYSEKIDVNQYKMMLVNALWVNEMFNILPSYQKLIRKDFHGETYYIDFSKPNAAIKIINSWLSSTTGKYFLFPKDIPTITQSLLISSLFLQGSWTYPFDTKFTGSKPFLTSRNTSKNIPTMHQVHTLPYYEDENSQIVALPIENQKNHAKIALVIFLPKKHLLSGIFDFYYAQQQANPNIFLTYINKLENQNIDLYLPRFSFNKQSFFKDFFISIGIQDVFSKKSNFSRLTNDQTFFISNIFHQSSISIDEVGIFSSTNPKLSLNSPSSTELSPSISFFANHPFFYCILDLESKLLLFMGVVNDPTESIDLEKQS